MLPQLCDAVRRLGYRSLVTLLKADGTDAAGVVVLKLDRPNAKNALSRAMVDELDRHTTELSSDKDVRCVLLASSTSDIFCAGADLKERLGMTKDEASRTVNRLRAVFDCLARLKTPTIAVVEGGAFGGGAELALACDIRVGGPGACFAFPETRLAILPGAGGTQRLPRLIGPSKAKELIFTGKRVDAEAALKLGLLDHLISDPMTHALQLASEIRQGGPVGVQMAKRAIDDGADMPMRDALEIESQRYAATLTTEDRFEGLRAFTEKRKPHYKGS